MVSPRSRKVPTTYSIGCLINPENVVSVANSGLVTIERSRLATSWSLA